MRRLTALGLLAAMLLAPACSKAKPGAAKVDSPQSTVKAEPVGPVTLRVMEQGSSTTALDAVISAFYQMHPAVRVEKVPQPPSNGDDRALYQSVLDGHKADIISLLSMVKDNFTPSQLIDLAPYAQKSRLDLTALATDLDSLHTDGLLLSLPYTVQPTVIIYNKEMFQAAGVPFPRAGWTWDQLRETAARLTKGTGDQKIWGFAPPITDMFSNLYVYQEDPFNYIIPSDDVIKQMLQLFGTMILTDGSVPATKSLQNERNDLSHAQDFDNGRAAMSVITLSGNGIVFSPPSFAWGVVPLPTRTGDKTRGNGWVAHLAIAGNTSYPDLAWEFVRLAVSPEGAGALARAGYLPMNRAEGARKAWLESVKAPGEGFADLLDVRWTTRPTSWRTTISQSVIEAYRKAVHDTLSGATSWENAYADFKQAR